MHIHFEKSINAKCDCTILSMSWMGKVPDELPEDEGWKLNRTNYYQEGWLATANVRGILGVTYTTCNWKKNLCSSQETPRKNFNLRGHRAQVISVNWNEPYQKLASCDSSGIIFVWIKFEGRWSIELINDRSTPVTHFSWSHDGRMALICYQDGFVLVGSVAGQRYWSSMLNLEATIMCGIWNPQDTQVYFGTSQGQVIIMDVHGSMISQVQLSVESPIINMAWSCEKFKMEENEDGNGESSSSQFSSPRAYLLAVTFKNGVIYMMKNYDDVTPAIISTGLMGIIMEWSNSGEYLAVAGSRPVETFSEAGLRILEYHNELQFYSTQGSRILSITIPYTQSAVTAMTWGHNDKRLFVCTGKIIHVGWLSKKIASLQLLCRLSIYRSLSTETCVSHLPLPLPVRALISSLHTQTIEGMHLPNTKQILDFVSHPPHANQRLHCTMIKHEEDTSQSPGTAYTLYLEYLGGLIPILKGKRTSKIRPEFVIFDPQTGNNSGGGVGGEGGGGGGVSYLIQCSTNEETANANNTNSIVNKCEMTRRRGGGGRDNISSSAYSYPTVPNSYGNSPFDFSDDSSSSSEEMVELCASPRMQRRRHRHRIRERELERLREREREWERNRSGIQFPPQEIIHPDKLIYSDTLPETVKIVEVSSNIWGTKFKIHGLVDLPSHLGQVTYKTSLLHLQPRQMTLLMTELKDHLFLNPLSLTADDEEDFSVIVGGSGDLQDHHQIFYHHQRNQLLQENQLQPIPPPILPTNRCYLQPRNSPNTLQKFIVGPIGPMGPSPSESIGTAIAGRGQGQCQGQQGQGQGSSSNNSIRTNNEEYVDLTSIPELNCYRDNFKNNINYEYGYIPHSSNSQNQVKGQGQCLYEDRSIGHQVVNYGSSIRRSNLVTSQAQVERVGESTTNTTTSERLPSISSLSGMPGPSSSSRTNSIRSPSRISWLSQLGGNNGENAITSNAILASAAVAVPSSAPIYVRRSVSASYLDNVDRNLQNTLDVVNGNSPPKRLVLVKNGQLFGNRQGGGGGGGSNFKGSSASDRPRLKECGKSISWDSYDWKQRTNLQETFCPNCKFSIKKKPHLFAGEIPGTSYYMEPPTPARTVRNIRSRIPLSNSNNSNRRNSNSSNSNSNNIGGRSNNEDLIERASVSQSGSGGERERETPPPPPPQTPPPSTSFTRRSLNLLTPLLKRRELMNRNKNNPPSSSFIPPASPQHQARSNPATPATVRKKKKSYLSSASSPFRQLFANSPLLSRRKNNKSSQTNTTLIDDSDDDSDFSFGNNNNNESKNFGINYHAQRSRTNSQFSNSSPFRDLESFQRNQLRQKLRKKKIHNAEKSPIVRPRRREFLMHNKAPMWNENSQVYQLDFGGRVTQESAKNFQIEFRGKQVMQFGRIDSNQYTLDFQYPFSALQAFAVSLANVTQRLK